MELKRLQSKFLDSNTFVLSNNGECLIVDAGATLQEIKNAVGKNKVVGLILTHGHYDHVFYAKEIRAAFGCPVYANEKAKVTMADPKQNYGETFAITDFDGFKFFSGDTKLKIGSFNVQAYELPGHSLCSAGYITEGVLFAGDVLFSHGIGRTDLIGGSKADMLASLKKIETLDFEVVASGHGENSTKDSQQRNLTTFIRFLSR